MKINYIFKKLNSFFRYGYINAAGRNYSGHICVRHKAGFFKIKKNLFIDWYKRINLFGYIMQIRKIVWFSGFIGLIIYQNGLSTNLLIADKVQVGMKIYNGDKFLNKNLINGYSICLKYIPLFTKINNIELKTYLGSSLLRAAGTSTTITMKTNNTISIKLKSGWNLTLNNQNLCTIGNMSNPGHKFMRLEKAGINRALGVRPTVRGVAQNPCDHPHGGGEGKKSPPAAQRSIWGWLTKGTLTTRKKFKLLIRKKLKD